MQRCHAAKFELFCDALMLAMKGEGVQDMSKHLQDHLMDVHEPRLVKGLLSTIPDGATQHTKAALPGACLDSDS